jgi:hypothetical protein
MRCDASRLRNDIQCGRALIQGKYNLGVPKLIGNSTKSEPVSLDIPALSFACHKRIIGRVSRLESMVPKAAKLHSSKPFAIPNQGFGITHIDC